MSADGPQWQEDPSTDTTYRWDFHIMKRGGKRSSVGAVHVLRLSGSSPSVLSSLVWWLSSLWWPHCGCIPVSGEWKRWRGKVSKGCVRKSFPFAPETPGTLLGRLLQMSCGQSWAPGVGVGRAVTGQGEGANCAWLRTIHPLGLGRGLAMLLNTFGFCYWARRGSHRQSIPIDGATAVLGSGCLFSDFISPKMLCPSSV